MERKASGGRWFAVIWSILVSPSIRFKPALGATCLRSEQVSTGSPRICKAQMSRKAIALPPSSEVE